MVGMVTKAAFRSMNTSSAAPGSGLPDALPPA